MYADFLADFVCNNTTSHRYVCVGIEGAFYEPGQKTVIPCKVTGKFSIRIVPDMSPEKVTELVCKHVNNIWAVRGSPNDMK